MRILLATDGSRYALAAARALAGWFAWPGGEVDVLAVAPPEPPSDRRPPGRKLGRAQEWRGTVGRWLSSTERRLAASGLRANPMTRHGNPASVVPEVAAEGGYDLVVVGAKGRGREPHLRLGSVARALVEHLPSSLLLVRGRAPKSRARRLPKRESPLQTVTVHGKSAASKSLLALESRLTDARDGRALDDEPAPSEMIEAAEDADLLLIDAGVRGAADVAEQCPCSVLLIRKPARPAVRAGAEEPEDERRTPFQVSYEGVEPSPEVGRHVLRGIERLERVAPDLIGIDVALALRNPRQRTGNLYDVTLRLSVAGPDVIVSRTPPPRAENENLVAAINGAFRSARRQLIERRAVESGRVKAKEPLRE